MQTIPARELKRCGISVVDKLLEEGAVHVIKNDRPAYVILTEQHYRELVDDAYEALVARVQASRKAEEAGELRRYTAAELIAETERLIADGE